MTPEDQKSLDIIWDAYNTHVKEMNKMAADNFAVEEKSKDPNPFQAKMDSLIEVIRAIDSRTLQEYHYALTDSLAKGDGTLDIVDISTHYDFIYDAEFAPIQGYSGSILTRQKQVVSFARRAAQCLNDNDIRIHTPLGVDALRELQGTIHCYCKGALEIQSKGIPVLFDISKDNTYFPRILFFNPIGGYWVVMTMRYRECD